MSRAAALLIVAIACAPAAPPSTSPTPAPTRLESEPASPAPIAAMEMDAGPELTPGCEKDARGQGPARPPIELGRATDGSVWLWACRALGAFGVPKLRSSGHPDWKIADGPSGGCFTLSIEDSAALVHHAPPERGAALKRWLEAAAAPDCSFELGTDGSGAWPRRAGLKKGQPFEERLYEEGFRGARRWFEEHPNEHSASGFISRWLELAQSERPSDLGPLLDRALSLELDALERMERGMLSPIGLQGYCRRSRDLKKLPVSKALRVRVDALVKRFC